MIARPILPALFVLGLFILLPAFLLPRRFRRRQTGDIQK